MDDIDQTQRDRYSKKLCNLLDCSNIKEAYFHVTKMHQSQLENQKLISEMKERIRHLERFNKDHHYLFSQNLSMCVPTQKIPLSIKTEESVDKRGRC